VDSAYIRARRRPTTWLNKLQNSLRFELLGI
jgi:hypothetical protein